MGVEKSDKGNVQATLSNEYFAYHKAIPEVQIGKIQIDVLRWQIVLRIDAFKSGCWLESFKKFKGIKEFAKELIRLIGWLRLQDPSMGECPKNYRLDAGRMSMYGVFQ